MQEEQTSGVKLKRKTFFSFHYEVKQKIFDAHQANKAKNESGFFALAL